LARFLAGPFDVARRRIFELPGRKEPACRLVELADREATGDDPPTVAAGSQRRPNVGWKTGGMLQMVGWADGRND